MFRSAHRWGYILICYILICYIENIAPSTSRTGLNTQFTLRVVIMQVVHAYLIMVILPCFPVISYAKPTVTSVLVVAVILSLLIFVLYNRASFWYCVIQIFAILLLDPSAPLVKTILLWWSNNYTIVCISIIQRIRTYLIRISCHYNFNG